MILDSRGNQIEIVKPRKKELTRDSRCPKCGADNKNIRPTLGGWLTCMKCGHQSKEARGE